MFAELTPESLRQFRALYFNLALDYPHSVLLDSCGWKGKTGGHYLMGFEAQEVIRFDGRILWHNEAQRTVIEEACHLWKALEDLFPQASSPGNDLDFPFVEGWVGALGYELNNLLEPSIPDRYPDHPMGVLYFVRFKHLILWKPETKLFQVLSPEAQWLTRVAQAMVALEDAAKSAQGPLSKMEAPHISLTPEAFEKAVMDLKAHIESGNLYQANLSLRFESKIPSRGNLLGYYEALVAQNPSPFSGIFQTPEGVILSNSPERLIKLTANNQKLETRPIAGTRGRGKTAAEEQAIAQTLQTDVKEQAEHLMMVDLERNDLGRVALAGSVQVTELGVLERYSHVTHIVSQVEGSQAPGKTRWEILEAMFPGGTITGCPKVRSMQIIQSLEPVPRGFYTGSLGYLDIRGNLDFNILIRSLFCWPDGCIHYHAGAGIVADSVPVWEYKECLRKAQVIQGVLHHDQPTCHCQ